MKKKFDIWFETHADSEFRDDEQKLNEYVTEFNKVFKKNKNILEYIKLHEGTIELSDEEIEKYLICSSEQHLDVIPGYVANWRWNIENNPVCQREKAFMKKYGYSCEEKYFYTVTRDGSDYLKDNYNVFILPNCSFFYLTIKN